MSDTTRKTKRVFVSDLPSTLRLKASSSLLSPRRSPVVPERTLRWTGLCLALALQAGCAALPRSGPMASDIRDEAQSPKQFPFLLVPVTQQVIQAEQAYQPPSDEPVLPYNRRHNLTLGPGDSLQVTLFQAGPGGAFGTMAATLSGGGGATASGATPPTSISGLTINESGNIFFPYAGLVHVGGLTVDQAETLILSRLQTQMIEPQVVITVLSNVSNVVTLTGAIKTPGRVMLTPAGENLLDVITTAGGPTNLPTDTWVELTRHGIKTSVLLQDLLENPSYDVQAMPGDLINLVLRPRTYSTFGATGHVAEYAIDPAGVTMAQALARAGGTVDSQSDSQGVFLFRYEHPSVLRAAGVSPPAGQGDRVPVVYSFNMGQAPGYFLATEFPIRPHDLIFSSDARLIQWQKALSLFGAVTSPVSTGTSIAR